MDGLKDFEIKELSKLKYKSQEGKVRKSLINKIKGGKETINISSENISKIAHKEFNDILKAIDDEKGKLSAIIKFGSFERNATGSGRWSSNDDVKLMYLKLIFTMRERGILDLQPIEVNEDKEENE